MLQNLYEAFEDFRRFALRPLMLSCLTRRLSPPAPRASAAELPDLPPPLFSTARVHAPSLLN